MGNLRKSKQHFRPTNARPVAFSLAAPAFCRPAAFACPTLLQFAGIENHAEKIVDFNDLAFLAGYRQGKSGFSRLTLARRPCYINPARSGDWAVDRRQVIAVAGRAR
ncbi:MAG: hypothetical protein JRJ56_07645 [Deltaproteobacteria bacterium]|nr:hypothetical protein [Deltaproteobacteria bacterium]